MLINNLCLGASPFNSLVRLCPSPFQAAPPQSHWGLTGQQTKPTVSRRCPLSLALRNCSKILKGSLKFWEATAEELLQCERAAAFWARSTAALQLWAAEERLFCDTGPFTITGLRKQHFCCPGCCLSNGNVFWVLKDDSRGPLKGSRNRAVGLPRAPWEGGATSAQSNCVSYAKCNIYPLRIQIFNGHLRCWVFKETIVRVKHLLGQEKKPFSGHTSIVKSFFWLKFNPESGF